MALDPRRSTAFGFWRMSRDYLHAARAVRTAHGERKLYPLLYLYGLAIELGLKAFLLERGNRFANSKVYRTALTDCCPSLGVASWGLWSSSRPATFPRSERWPSHIHRINFATSLLEGPLFRASTRFPPQQSQSSLALSSTARDTAVMRNTMRPNITVNRTRRLMFSSPVNIGAARRLPLSLGVTPNQASPQWPRTKRLCRCYKAHVTVEQSASRCHLRPRRPPSATVRSAAALADSGRTTSSERFGSRATRKTPPITSGATRRFARCGAKLVGASRIGNPLRRSLGPSTASI